MELRLDLHIHSKASVDGRLSVEEIVKIAKKRGLDAIAICDHGTRYTGPTEIDGLTVIPGIECTTEDGHILGLFVERDVEFSTPVEAVEAIHRAGGIAVLAHPFEHTCDRCAADSLTALLDGVEIWNSRANRKNKRANAMAVEFAADTGLRPFGGSDAHTPQEIGNAATVIEVEDASLENMKRALLSGDQRVWGKNSGTRFTARSQLTKLRKRKSGPKGYIKWAAFMAKCILQDILSAVGMGN